MYAKSTVTDVNVQYNIIKIMCNQPTNYIHNTFINDRNWNYVPGCLNYHDIYKITLFLNVSGVKVIVNKRMPRLD